MNARLHSSSRREFLKTSVAVGGGLVVGLYLPQGGALASTGAEPGTLNAWVRIAPDNTITLICHRNEMGQDVHTSLALLIAEELNVDVNRVTVQQAPVDPVYVNALLGAQITGGSTAIRDAWMKLREAGATARMQLVGAAASRWKVPAAECVAKDGFVSHASGKRASYGELADAAGKLPAPTKVALKSPAEFTQIGKQQHRLDSPAKARGQAIFRLDVAQPGMLYASLEQCPVIGGKAVSVDDSAAKAMKGVVARREHRRGRGGRRGSLLDCENGARRAAYHVGLRASRDADDGSDLRHVEGRGEARRRHRQTGRRRRLGAEDPPRRCCARNTTCSCSRTRRWNR